jgi:hypothetical protein
VNDVERYPHDHAAHGVQGVMPVEPFGATAVVADKLLHEIDRMCFVLGHGLSKAR